jgi:integrase
MSATSSHGPGSRRPLVYNGKTVPNVSTRTTASGETKFEFVSKRNGRISRKTLAAKTATDAVNEANRLRVIVVEKGIADGTLRLGSLLNRFLAEVRSGEYAPPRGLADSTLELYEQRLHSHILAALGESTRVRDVQAAHLRAVIDRMRAKGLSGSTIRGTIAAAAAMFRFGVHRGLIDRSPALDLDGDLPSGQRQTEPVYLSRAQVDELLPTLGDEFRPIVAVLVFLALRVSECLGLCWGDLDLVNGTATIRRQLGRDGCTLVGLKTRGSGATLTIPAPLIVELRSHRERQARLGFERVGADRLVFVTRAGVRSPGRRNVLRAIQRSAERLGLRNEAGELLGAHDLRHSTAGLLRDAGMSDEDIAPVLRHSNSRTTSQMYGGRAEDAIRGVRERAAEALA